MAKTIELILKTTKEALIHLIYFRISFVSVMESEYDINNYEWVAAFERAAAHGAYPMVPSTQETEEENIPRRVHRRHRSVSVRSPDRVCEAKERARTTPRHNVVSDPLTFPFTPEDPEEIPAPPPPPRITVGGEVFREWHRPSSSKRPVVSRITREAHDAFAPIPQSRGQELILQRARGNLESRTVFPKGANIQELLAKAEERARGARGESRDENLSSVWKGYVAWNLEMIHPEDVIDHALRIMMYLEAKMSIPPKKEQPIPGKILYEEGHIVVSTAFKYSKDLKQLVFQTGGSLDTIILADYQESLKKSGALLPQHQAIPAERKDVEAALSLMAEREVVGLMLAWLTSSRIGEMPHLTRDSFVDKGDGLWVVTFPYHKGDPFRLGTAIPVHLGSWRVRLEKWIHSLRPGEQFTSLTTARAAAILDRVRTGLTAHSIKRGALVTMLRAGVPLSMIQIMAKHKDLETLLMYLPRDEVVLSMGVSEASRVL